MKNEGRLSLTETPMDPWIHGSMDPWIHGSMDPWIHGSIYPWIHGSMDKWRPELRQSLPGLAQTSTASPCRRSYRVIFC